MKNPSVKQCYYCGGLHDDDPCPIRKRDAERHHRIGQYWYARLEPVVCPACNGSWITRKLGGCVACASTGIKRFDSAKSCGTSSSV